MRSELERVAPSAVGLSSDAMCKYINNLEKSGTEMHGLMIARHGKVCLEGWWKPYSPMLRHGLQSLTKSYTVSAIGHLFTEGKIKLDEKLVDILPEHMPENISDNLRLLTVRDMLCMGTGLESMQDRTKDTWVNDLFASEFVNRPGTKFFYSGVITSVLGVVLRKKTGMGLMEYMKPRIFDKIGIDTDNLKWIEHPDGMEYGGGGLFATTEDNLRLGLLYLNGGVWEGERILSKEWVDDATTKQIDNSNEKPADNKVGYGYQMWMCQPEDVYRFDGAHGQFSIVVPKMDMAISITQFASGEAVQKTLDVTWEYLKEAEGADEDEACLLDKLDTLFFRRGKLGTISEKAKELYNKSFELEANNISLLPGVYRMLSHKLPKGLDAIGFVEGKGELLLEVRTAGRDYTIHVSMDGVDRLSRVFVAHDLPDMVYAAGFWNEEGQLELDLDFIETCYNVKLIVYSVGQGIEVKSYQIAPFAPGGSVEMITKSVGVN